MVRAFRNAVIGSMVCCLFAVPVCFAQAPIIVDLGMSVLRGLATGAAEVAGKAVMENWTRQSAGGENPQPKVPPSDRSAPTVQIEPSPPPDGVRWHMRNEYGTNIVVQFYAPERHVRWPAGNRAYLLVSGQTELIRLRCVPGERVCYGGGVPGRYWGTGIGRGFRPAHACTNCCRRCGSEGLVVLR
jgi:hypothetical protein